MIIVTLPSLYLFMAGKNLLVELETAKLGRKKKKKKDIQIAKRYHAFPSQFH